MLAYEGITGSSRNLTELHKLRIAAKRLRYTLEEFKQLKYAHITGALSEATLIQDTLGQMHNYYVWMHPPVKNAFLAGYLRRICTQNELRAYRQFIAAWKRQKRQRVWKDLSLLLSR